MASNAAFEVLYRDYYVRVFGLCRRLLDTPEQAEDATQEAFVKAYRNFGKYKPDQAFWSWIAAIASNHCIDVLRRGNHRESLFGDEVEELAGLQDAGVLGEVLAGEDAQALHRAIAGLDPKYRVPVVLKYFSDESYDEIAERLDITRNHVGVLLARGKARLQTALSRSMSGDAS